MPGNISGMAMKHRAGLEDRSKAGLIRWLSQDFLVSACCPGTILLVLPFITINYPGLDIKLHGHTREVMEEG